MATKKRSKGFCIFAFGAKKASGISQRSIQSALKKIVEDRGEDLNYVLVGNVRETEKMIYSACRAIHFPVAVLPADFEKFSINAEALRNGLALGYFKPSHILMAHKEPEEDGPAKTVISWAKKNNVDVTKIPASEKRKVNA